MSKNYFLWDTGQLFALMKRDFSGKASRLPPQMSVSCIFVRIIVKVAFFPNKHHNVFYCLKKPLLSPHCTDYTLSIYVYLLKKVKVWVYSLSSDLLERFHTRSLCITLGYIAIIVLLKWSKQLWYLVNIIAINIYFMLLIRTGDRIRKYDYNIT